MELVERLLGTRRRTSRVLRLQAGRWRSVHVELRRERGGVRATDAGPRQVPGSVRQVAVLTADDGDTFEIVLDAATLDEARAGRVGRLRWRLEEAADGQVGLSADGERWRPLALDAPTPFCCAHVALGSAGDRWGGAPSTRELLLQVLASSTRDDAAGAPNHCELTWNDRDPDGSVRLLGAERLHRMKHGFVAELRAALDWAETELADPEVRGALVSAVERPGRQLEPVRARFDALLRAAAAEWVDVRVPLSRRLRGEGWSAAVAALDGLDDDPLRESVLAAVTELAPHAGDDPDRLAGLVWLLTRLGPGLHPEAGHPVLRDLAAGHATSAVPALRTAARLAVRALGQRGARDALGSLTSGPRRAWTVDGVLREQPSPPPAQPPTGLPHELSLDRTVWYDVAVHADQALASLDAGR